MGYAVVMAAPDIYHHGIKGQKWGVRRYQNKDGSLTSSGKKRYGVNDNKKQLSDFTRSKIEKDKAYVSSKAYQDMMRKKLDKNVEKYGEAAVKQLMESYSFYEIPTLANVSWKARKERKNNNLTVAQVAKRTKQLDINDYMKDGKLDMAAGYRAFTKLDDYYKKLDPNATPTERQQKLAKRALALAKAKDVLNKESMMKRLVDDVNKTTKKYGREAVSDLLLSPIAKVDSVVIKEFMEFNALRPQVYNQQAMMMYTMGAL